MTWFRVDDKWPTDPKVLDAGRDGRALWLCAGALCAGVDSDGLVPPRTVKVACQLAEVSERKASALLVAAGLWHDSTTVLGCAPCAEHVVRVSGEPLPPGWFLFHRWWKYQLCKAGKTDSIEREHDLRRKRLSRDTRLCADIRQRDRDLCRYCGELTRWDGDRKTARAGTYDHVDPFGGNTLENVVVACRRCNGRKASRTPEQAGMALRPAPPPYLAVVADPAGTDSRSSPDRSDQAPPHADRTGTGRDGSGLDSGSSPGWSA